MPRAVLERASRATKKSVVTQPGALRQADHVLKSITFLTTATASISDVLKFLWEVLSLQSIDDFMRACVQSHIRPIIKMAIDPHRVNDLPSGKIFHDGLQLIDDHRLQ